ncbi:forkhead box protein R1-like isoform X2 [Mastomys coucha]|uniref:forkhead box protein R1-like isoform X2 n=1 Tax=Mastomys coucha TaxID=35658 RepID=UPI0012617F6F|nr:forkhead box protein R1-like isoform X2 [Mastomys coucha]
MPWAQRACERGGQWSWLHRHKAQRLSAYPIEYRRGCLPSPVQRLPCPRFLVQENLMSASWLEPEAIRSVCRGAALLTAPTRDCLRFEEAPSTRASLSATCTLHRSSPPALKMDPKFQNRDFWASLHGQVPGLLDWDMGNECFLSFTSTQLSEAEQKLALYGLRIVKPPKLPLEKIPNPDKDGPDIKPNLWMWVNPNIVYPPGKLEVAHKKEDLPSVLPAFQPDLKEREDSCSEASEMSSPQPLPPPLPRKQKKKLKEQHVASSPSTWEEPTEEEEAKDHDDSSSVALPSLPTRAPLQSRWRLPQAISPEGRLWSRPPLHYFHLIALALRNSPPCGLNVQQIYSFTRSRSLEEYSPSQSLFPRQL